MSVGLGFDVSPAEEGVEELDCPAVSPFKNLASNILTSSFDCEKNEINFVNLKKIMLCYLLLHLFDFSNFR